MNVITQFNDRDTDCLTFLKADFCKNCFKNISMSIVGLFLPTKLREYFGPDDDGKFLLKS